MLPKINLKMNFLRTHNNNDQMKNDQSGPHIRQVGSIPTNDNVIALWIKYVFFNFMKSNSFLLTKYFLAVANAKIERFDSNDITISNNYSDKVANKSSV